MKTMLCRLIMGSIVVLAPVFAPMAFAESVIGRVNFVRTFPSETVIGVQMARFEMRVVGTCDGVSTGDDGVFIRVRSGQLSGIIGEINALSFKNAYSTALAAVLTGQSVQVDSLPSCFEDVVTIDSPIRIGIFSN